MNGKKRKICKRGEQLVDEMAAIKKCLAVEECWEDGPWEGLVTAGGVVTGAGSAGIAIDMLVAEEVNRAPQGSDWWEL
jgi:hypothetical protein